jgi:hypothetical protein
MGLADDHFICTGRSVLMSALGPQSPQSKFLLVEGCDVRGEEGGTTGAQGIHEPEVGNALRLKDGVEGTVELLELRIEPLQPRLSAFESAGGDVRQQRI